MIYVIQRNDGKFLKRRSGGWTNKLQEAEIYGSPESARQELCPENECIRSVEDVMEAGE